MNIKIKLLKPGFDLSLNPSPLQRPGEADLGRGRGGVESLVITFFIFIIVLFPLLTLAHEEHDKEMLQKYRKEAGILPGEFFYPFDRMGDWIRINLLTLSTKQKQQKKLKVSQERLAELVTLAEIVPGKIEALDKAVSGYQKYLYHSRDMAQKIIFLDGAEIGLARQAEFVSRENERVISGLLESVSEQARPAILSALTQARAENEEIFKFIIKNYQFTHEDIEKNKAVIDEHIKMVEGFAGMEAFVLEAKKFRDAGLTIEAYDFVKKAKDLAYKKIPNPK